MEGVAYFDKHALTSLGISGTVKFKDLENGKTEVKIQLKGLSPGLHGIHLHESGDISKGCAGACSHYNPKHTTHGSIEFPDCTRHVGDLCNNVKANTKGIAAFQYEDDLLKVNQTFGRAVVVHRWPDDLGQGNYDNLTFAEVGKLCKDRGYKLHPRTRQLMIEKMNSESLKTGNAGQRLACSVVGRASNC